MRTAPAAAILSVRLATRRSTRNHESMSLWQPGDLPGMRLSYERGRLTEEDLADTPLSQFLSWMADAVSGSEAEPNAAVLATADASGVVTARTILLKGADARGFLFFTNYTSRKARAVAENPRVSLVFPWLTLQRQVTVVGRTEKLPPDESAEYFRSRPHLSQVAAWASRQSEPLSNREQLEVRAAELDERWGDGTPPVPDFWGGYVVRPTSVEFWQGRASRMHDRLRFEAIGDDGTPALDLASDWAVQRYSP